MLEEQLIEVGNLTDDDLLALMQKNLGKTNKSFCKNKGYNRGSTLFRYCVAVAIVKEEVKKRQGVVLAAFGKLPDLVNDV